MKNNKWKSETERYNWMTNVFLIFAGICVLALAIFVIVEVGPPLFNWIISNT